MNKKFVLIFFLSVLLVSSLNSNNFGTNAVSAQIKADESNVRMIGLDLQLKRPNQDNYFSVNTSQSASINDVENRTSAIFIATFVNQNSTAILLNSFNVYLFNHTTTTVAAQTLTLQYETSTPNKIEIPANGAYTEIYH